MRGASTIAPISALNSLLASVPAMREFMGVFLTLIAVSCNTPDPNAVANYCRGWSAKYASAGTHANRAAYENDLMITCMAIKKTPYKGSNAQYEPQKPRRPSDDWVNPDVPKEQFTKAFGRDKAKCIERGYIGQKSEGRNRGDLSGSAAAYQGIYGAGVSGTQSGTFESTPAFDNELFMACMNEAGWELVSPDR